MEDRRNGRCACKESNEDGDDGRATYTDRSLTVGWEAGFYWTVDLPGLTEPQAVEVRRVADQFDGVVGPSVLDPRVFMRMSTWVGPSVLVCFGPSRGVGWFGLGERVVCGF
jgi:hypothetical protein